MLVSYDSRVRSGPAREHDWKSWFRLVDLKMCLLVCSLVSLRVEGHCCVYIYSRLFDFLFAFIPDMNFLLNVPYAYLYVFIYSLTYTYLHSF